MTTRNGTAARIVAYVAAHPGCTRAELLQGCGISQANDAMPAYCRKVGLIHPAGPRGSQRYYPTAEQAAAVHQQLVALVAQKRLRKKQTAWRIDNVRRRAKRHAEGGRKRDTRPGQHSFVLAPGVKLAKDVRVTIAPPMRDRWAA